MENPSNPAPDDAMLAGMEKCVAAMKDARPISRASPTVSMSEAPRPHDEDDSLAAAPWQAMDLALTEVAAGTRLGRYLLLHELGRGGMGVVYAAYDPQLERKLAIKLLRGPSSRGDPDHAHRLVREARALARLAHPHVVAVHDVGFTKLEADATEPVVFVAMEHVDGTTMRGWLAHAPRSSSERLAMLEQAGRGLAAAHDVGLVHRDFKPDNVMVGNDGRARVMDFGLARLFDDTRAPPTSDTSDTSDPLRSPPLALHSTRPGAVLGTPAYMAPEQYDGRADASSDQFAFCVVAWEALHGRRPFEGGNLVSLAAAVMEGHIEPLGPDDRPVPAWIRDVLRRGLEVAPARRFPSMHELLAALADDPSRRRRRWLLAGGVLGLVGIAGSGLAWDRLARERSCSAAGAAIAEVWNDDARATVEVAIDAVDVPYAEDTRTRVVAGLAGYADRWSAVRESTCRAHVLEGRHDDALAARADACLDERRDALAAWVELLPSADTTAIAFLVEVTTELPAVEPCADAAALARSPAPPDDPRLQAEVASLQRRLARARSLSALRRRDEASTLARSVESEAEAAGATWLQASAAMVVADVAFATGNEAEGRAGYERAVASAMAASEDVLAIRALTELTLTELTLTELKLTDVRAGRLERAEARLVMARALLPRIEPEPGVVTLSVLDGEGALALARGDYRDAVEVYARAMALAEERLPSGHPRFAMMLGDLGNAQLRQGDASAAIETFTRVIALREQTLGSGHPSLVMAYDALARAQSSAGRHAEAEATMLR
jgi:tetratricopeptide (TPR) repeat protein